MTSKDVFISHSSKDNDAVRQIASILSSNKISYWLDLNDIPANGKPFAGHITQGLSQAKVFLLVLSSAANSSPHVLNEVNMAFSQGLPFLIYNVDLNEADFTDDLKYYLASKQFIKVYELGEQKSLLLLLQYIKGYLNGTDTQTLKAANQQVKPAKPEGSSLRLKIFTAVLCAFSAGTLIHTYAPELIKFSDYKRVEFKIGDIVELGSYHEKPLLWVYAGSSPAKDAQSFISRNLITAKPFDVARSGHYKTDRNGLKDSPNKSMKLAERNKLFTAEEFIDMYGSADYESSSLRTWLNSKDNSVKYPSGKPVPANIKSTGKNRYLVSRNIDNLDEGGFLTGFTAEELAMLAETSVRYMVTKNNLDKADNRGDSSASVWQSVKLFPDADTLTENNMTLMLRIFKSVDFGKYYYHEIKEYVSLPSLDEIGNFYSGKGLNLQNQFDYVRFSDDEENPMDNGWWTRTPCGMMPYTICMVHPSPNSNNVSDLQVTPTTVSEMATVRPVIHIHQNQIECVGDGSKASPYKCKKK